MHIQYTVSIKCVECQPKLIHAHTHTDIYALGIKIIWSAVCIKILFLRNIVHEKALFLEPQIFTKHQCYKSSANSKKQ